VISAALKCFANDRLLGELGIDIDHPGDALTFPDRWQIQLRQFSA
jgi:hypothetical protein